MKSALLEVSMSLVDELLSNIRMLAHYLVVAITNENDDMTTLIYRRSLELGPTSFYLFIRSSGHLHLAFCGRIYPH